MPRVTSAATTACARASAAAAAFELQILSRGDHFVRTRVGPVLQPMTGIGLLIALVAALLGLLPGTFLHAAWVFWHIGPLEIELGTPQLFDLGVFLVVVSVVVSYLLSLSLNKDTSDTDNSDTGNSNIGSVNTDSSGTGSLDKSSLNKIGESQ